MAIANELCSEVAAAMFEAHKREGAAADQCNIRDVIVAVHSTLRKLKAELRRARNQPSQAASESALSGRSTASGSR